DQITKSGIHLMLEHEVTSIDFDKKVIYIIDRKTGISLTKGYDRLMIATGGCPVVPPVKGIESNNVYTATKLEEVQKLKDSLKDIQHVAIIGGGFIGIEVAEQLAHQGKSVRLIESSPVLIGNVFDCEFSEKIYTAIQEKGIMVHL